MSTLKFLELFAGTRSIGKVAVARGHDVFSVDWDKKLPDIDLYTDIGTLTAQDILEKFGLPDVVWISFDCTTFSMAAISRHRVKNPLTGNLDPVSDYAKECDRIDQHVLEMVKDIQAERKKRGLSPAIVFIENPRAGLRMMTWMAGWPRYTVTYCQYGDTRMKPTDIFTNHPDPQFKPMCKNGDPCHEAAPRGSKTGTQGLRNARARGVIPAQLCEHIVDICEKHFAEEEDAWLY